MNPRRCSRAAPTIGYVLALHKNSHNYIGINAGRIVDCLNEPPNLRQGSGVIQESCYLTSGIRFTEALMLSNWMQGIQ